MQAQINLAFIHDEDTKISMGFSSPGSSIPSKIHSVIDYSKAAKKPQIYAALSGKFFKNLFILIFLYKSSNNHFSRIGGLHAWNDFRMVFIRSTRSHAECYVGGRYGEYLVLATLH